MKNSLDGPNRKLEMTGERVSELEDSSAEEQREKRLKENKQSSMDLWEKV